LFRQVETDKLWQILGSGCRVFRVRAFSSRLLRQASGVLKLGHFAVVVFLLVVLRRRIFLAGIGLLARFESLDDFVESCLPAWWI
jgi:hypothetical protein